MNTNTDTNTIGAWQGFKNLFKGGEKSTMAGIASGVNAIGNIAQVGFNMSIADKQMRRAKEANELARKQFETENKRYETLRKEQNESRASSANSAAKFSQANLTTPFARESTPTTPSTAQNGTQAQPQEPAQKELPMERD